MFPRPPASLVKNNRRPAAVGRPAGPRQQNVRSQRWRELRVKASLYTDSTYTFPQVDVAGQTGGAPVCAIWALLGHALCALSTPYDRRGGRWGEHSRERGRPRILPLKSCPTLACRTKRREHSSKLDGPTDVDVCSDCVCILV